MISIVYNEPNSAIEMHLDEKGADLLIERLQALKSGGGHLHLYATNDGSGLATKSPYGEMILYEQLILNLLPSEAWDDV